MIYFSIKRMPMWRHGRVFDLGDVDVRLVGSIMSRLGSHSRASSSPRGSGQGMWD